MKTYLVTTRFLLILFFTAVMHMGYAQEFPKSWEGKWKGTLNIYSAETLPPVKSLEMELDIQPVNDTVWNWTIHYLPAAAQPDLRKYELHASSGPSKWTIDEKNGIVLDQTFIGNRLTSSFSFDKTLLITSYWVEHNLMHFEITVTQLNPASTTGLQNEASPAIGNHPVNSYQHAVLYKIP